MNRIPQIQALRALAAVLVVIYHAKVTSGGYIGVDIFYVISGFRYGFLGQSDIGGAQAVITAAGGLLLLNVVLAGAVYALLRSGWKLKS